MRRVRNLAICLSLVLVAFLAAAGGASAAGIYRVLIVHSDTNPPSTLQNGIRAFPDVASVDLFDATDATPPVALLENYNLVVSMSGDPNDLDPSAVGDNLAAFYDHGGAVVQFAWDNDQNSGYAPSGRWASGGYQPFLPGPAPDNSLTLGTHDASSPYMQGVNFLQSDDQTSPALAPGATLLAKWSDDTNLIALKGRALSVSAYVGDDYFGPPPSWSGDFPRLVINSLHVNLPECVVPRLKKKKLKAAKKTLRSSNCAVGKVKRKKGHKKGKVRKQNPAPGTVLAGGSTVNIKVG
jgi:PASTA domain-containing protein